MVTLSNISKRSINGLGQRLRRHRTRRGLTMTQFSKTLGISTDALRSMERGRPGVSIGQWTEVLRRIKHLDDLDKLLSRPDANGTFDHQAHRRCLRHRTSWPRF